MRDTRTIFIVKKREKYFKESIFRESECDIMKKSFNLRVAEKNLHNDNGMDIGEL